MVPLRVHPRVICHFDPEAALARNDACEIAYGNYPGTEEAGKMELVVQLLWKMLLEMILELLLEVLCC